LGAVVVVAVAVMAAEVVDASDRVEKNHIA